MSVDKMSVDKMSVDEMSVDKMSVDEMTQHNDLLCRQQIRVKLIRFVRFSRVSVGVLGQSNENFLQVANAQ
jgi:hypothetical protein